MGTTGPTCAHRWSFPLEGPLIPHGAAPCLLWYTSWLLLEPQLDQVKENKSPRRHWGGCTGPPPPARSVNRGPGPRDAGAQRHWWQRRLDSCSGHQPGEAQGHQGTSAAQSPEDLKTVPNRPHLYAPETSLHRQAHLQRLGPRLSNEHSRVAMLMCASEAARRRPDSDSCGSWSLGQHD